MFTSSVADLNDVGLSGFDSVFGRRRGRDLNDTILALCPRALAHSEYKRLQPMNEVTLPHVLTLLRAHNDFARRPLLLELHHHLSEHIAAWAHPSNTPYLRDLMAVCGLRDRSTRRIFRVGNTLHFWAEGEQHYLPNQGLGVVFTCGLASIVTPKQQMDRGAWFMPGVVERRLLTAAELEGGPPKGPVVTRCAACAHSIQSERDSELTETKNYPHLPPAYERMHARACRLHAEAVLNDFLFKSNADFNERELAGVVAERAFIEIALAIAATDSQRIISEYLSARWPRFKRALPQEALSTIEFRRCFTAVLEVDNWLATSRPSSSTPFITIKRAHASMRDELHRQCQQAIALSA